MDDSILNTIKQMLGLDSDYDAFDTDVIIHINSALSTLSQVGVGPSIGFKITGPDEMWSEFIGYGINDLESVKTYVYCKVKMLFDPPASSFVMKAMEENCKEIEWRLNVASDPGDYRE